MFKDVQVIDNNANENAEYILEAPMHRYQSAIVKEYLTWASTGDTRTPILAMATGSGKGRTAIEIMAEMVIQNPNHKFLIIPHGQTILRDNFVGQLRKWPKPNLKYLEVTPGKAYSKQDFADYNVIVCLPQTARKLTKQFGKITCIVVDEAHQRYAQDNENKKEYNEIRSAFPKAKELLLTASHGGFSNETFKKFTFAMLDAYSEGAVSDVALVGVNTNWAFTVNDYSKSDEVNTSVAITPKEILDSLESLIQNMSVWHGSITTDSGIVGTAARKTASFFKLGAKFPKTLIACRSIAMAEEVHRYFDNSKRLKGRVLLSHSEIEEVEGSGLKDFDALDHIRLGVVVRRGNLGFDANTLECMVDMTGTMDENAMMQLIGRAGRLLPNGKQGEKVYFKVMPQNMEMLTRAMLQLSALLMTPDFYREYQGKDSEKKQIATVRRRQEEDDLFSPGKKPSIRKSGRGHDVEVIVPRKLSDLVHGADVFFKEYARKFGEELEPYTYTSIREIKKTLKGVYENSPWRLYTYAQEFAVFIQTNELKSFEEWRLAYSGCYASANLKNLLAEISKIVSMPYRNMPRVDRSYEDCLNDASKYNSLVTWGSALGSFYGTAKKNKWQQQIGLELWGQAPKASNGFWTYETCLAEAGKYDTYTNWVKGSNRSYNQAFNHGWLGRICEELNFKRAKKVAAGTWTLENCLVEAKNYASQSEWRKRSPVSYLKVSDLGKMKEICALAGMPFRVILPKGTWTYENCLKEALKYESTKAWLKGSSSSHSQAVRNGWIDSIKKEANFNTKTSRSTKDTLDVLAKLTFKPSLCAKDPVIRSLAKALAKIKQRHPKKYQELLLTNPKLAS